MLTDWEINNRKEILKRLNQELEEINKWDGTKLKEGKQIRSLANTSNSEIKGFANTGLKLLKK